MIQKIVEAVNDNDLGLGSLKIFQNINGLCEVVAETFKVEDVEVEAKFPAFYNGNDQLRYVTNLDYKVGVVFHLTNGDSSQSLMDRSRTAQRRYEKTYPMKCIAIIRRNIYNTDSAYSPSELISNMEPCIGRIAFPAVKAELLVDSVETIVASSSHDKEAILSDHFQNVEFDAVHNLMVVQINYDIKITGSEGCFLTYNC